MNSIRAFKDLLSYENWEDVFLEENVNIIFNNFLNTYLRIFNTCFPTIITHASQKLKPWLTTGIRTSCENKRKLYESDRNNRDLNEYYKKYCKILSAVIIAAKKKHFDRVILESTNRSRTTWKIVKTVTNNRISVSNAQTVIINNKGTTNPSTIADAFSSVADNLISKSFLVKNNEKYPLFYLGQNFTQSFFPLSHNYT
jgi:hypothetical protein